MHRICHRSHPTFASSYRKYVTISYFRLCAAHLLLYAQNTYRFHRRGPLVHSYIADAHILFKKHKIYLLHANTCLLVQLANTTSASPWKTPSHFAVPRKPLPRDSMRAKFNIPPRSSRHNLHPKHSALNPVYLRNGIYRGST